MCVLAACLLFTFCAVFAWERPNSNLQKRTVVNCQGWSLSCYPPHCIKKLRSSLWCAGTSALLGLMPQAFPCIHPLSVQLTSVKSLHKWILSSLHEMALSLKKNTQHFKHMTAKHRLGVDMGVLEIWRHVVMREVQIHFFFLIYGSYSTGITVSIWIQFNSSSIFSKNFQKMTISCKAICPFTA